jgi:hypothetical protein
MVRNFDPFSRKDMAMAKSFADRPVEKKKATNIAVQKTAGQANEPAIKQCGETMKACADAARNVPAAKKPIEPAVERVDGSNREEWIRQNAYARWIEGGRLEGDALRHWLEAERAYDDLCRVSPSKSRTSV